MVKSFFSDVQSKYKKHKKVVHIAVFLILMLIPIWYGAELRTSTYDIEVTERFAQQALDQNLRSQFAAAIRQDFPNLPDDQLNIRIDREIQKFQAR